MIQLRAAALSDIGRVRRENEDRFLCDLELGLFGVADGVGGLPGGGEAAETTLTHIRKVISDTTDPTPDLADIVRAANQAVYDLGEELSPETGIGSTLTLGHIRGDRIKIAHVGDSRAYLLRGDQFEALTMDHSVENEMRARRARGETVYFHEGNRNALTRCMGQPAPLQVDIVSRSLRARDRYFFCTDGVTRLVGEEEIAAFLSRDDEPDTVLRDIIALAIRRGGPDNATGVLFVIDRIDG